MTAIDRPPIDQKFDLRRLVNDAVDPLADDLGKELGKEALQRLFGRRAEFKSDLVALVRKHASKQPDHARAREILGEDFISPEEVRGVYPLLASDTMAGLPSDDDLRWLKANGYMLVPQPHKLLSVLEIRALDDQLFYAKTGTWYEEQKFGRDDPTGPCTSWLAIKKRPIANSTNKVWADQEKLLADAERLPNAAEVCWAITLYCKVRGVFLFPDVYVRTSSLDSNGNRVGVGHTGAGGLRIHNHWDLERLCRLGLAASRDF